ncbi:MAG: hypothetical protein HC852_00255 [Acaryochloridaceae cyanobacterium RU_4_10]|nr:hypothetical protein [Acaryochloridaceae cyanobacterium RU_4_10]
MQAHKLKGTIDDSGHLVISEPITIPPGNVEVIVWSSESMPETSISPEHEVSFFKPKRTVECDIPSLKAWLEKTEQAPSDFDADRAKWERLKEKHNL